MRQSRDIAAFLVPCTAVLGAIGGRYAHAIDKFWVDNANQTWTNSSNWNPSGQPTTSDTAIFNIGTVKPPYFVPFITAQFQAINAVADKLRIDSAPITFTVTASTLTLDSLIITEAGRALVIGRNASVPNAQLDNLLSQFNTTYGTLGLDAGSSGFLNINAGTFNVTGLNADWDLIIGSSGAGTINVNNGSDVVIAGSTALGLHAGSSGVISVLGAGSTWDSNGALHAGINGTGLVSISGGQASTLAFALGTSPTAEGTIILQGDASLESTGFFSVVGDQGQGSLNILSGSDVTNSNNLILGNNVGSNGYMQVNGSGSTLFNGTDVFGTLVGDITLAGPNATATMDILQGASVTAGGVRICSGLNATAEVNVDGEGSKLDAAILVGVAGQGAQGTLNITNGADVYANTATIAVTPNTAGEVNVDGAGSRMLCIDAADQAPRDCHVGGQGAAILNITDGGKVDCAEAVIAAQPGSAGTVFIDDGSLVADSLIVGQNGPGSISAASGSLGAGGMIRIGVHAEGEVNLSGGSILQSVGNSLVLGEGANGSGLLSMIDSIWIAGVQPAQIIIGHEGAGTLELTDSVILTEMMAPQTFANVIIGNNGPGIAVLDNSIWEMRPHPMSVFAMHVGLGESGSLAIMNGAIVGQRGSGSGIIAAIGGVNPDATAEVLIDGAGSTWNQLSTLDVGSALAPGALTVSNGGTVSANQISIAAMGEVTGDGVISGNVVNQGLLRPGDPVGMLTITSFSGTDNYQQDAAGELVMELASNTSFDQLAISGAATLDGALTVNLVDRFIPELGWTFTILSADDIDGQFATLNLPKGMEITYTSTAVIITMASCAADIAPQPAGDGVVDVDDLLAVINNWGACAGCVADINGDDVVDVDDLLAVINAWGACE